jgi:hypothetical protein
MKHSALVPLLLAACAARAPQAPQAEASVPASVAESRVVRAALFKNGLAFVRREAQLPAGAKELRLVDLPPPVHGTFWIVGDPARVELGTAVARADERSERVEARNVADLLRANVGRQVTLHLHDGATLAGRIAHVDEPELQQPQPQPWDARPVWYPPPMPSPAVPMVHLDDGTTTNVVPVGEVRRLSAASGSLERSVESRSPATSLTVTATAKGGAAAELGLQYLVRGLTWAPSYAIDIATPGRARLTAKAVVINESEDLAGATLEFVTGYPNLRFQGVVDPLALRGDLAAFLAALQAEPGAQSAVMAQSVMSNVAMREADAASFPEYGAPEGGAAVEDLFFYEQRDVTLARGERGLYPLFTLDVPCSHVFEWSIPDTIEPQPMHYGQPEQVDEEEVWHSLKLENTSSMPWTTAPALTQSGTRLLGQDTLRYTAAGAATTLRITRAIDVAAERAELETTRERGLRPPGGGTYDLVSVEGTLRVTNRRADPITLEVEKLLRGELTANPDEARVETLAEGLRRVNPSLRLEWSVPVAAGATVELRYAYKVYVPG